MPFSLYGPKKLNCDMIIYDEDFQRIYKQMHDERERVDYYLKKHQRPALKTLAKTPAPCYYSAQVTFDDTKNTYLLYYYCANEHERRKGNCFYGSLLLLDGKDGHRIAIRLMTISERTGAFPGKHDTLQVFTGHFFSRYRERFSSFGGLGTSALIVTFAGRNLGYMCKLDYEKMVLEKNRTPNGCVWGMDDGFSFGENEWIDMGVYGKVLVVKHKTFLGEDDLKDDQYAQTLPVDLMRSMLLNHFKN